MSKNKTKKLIILSMILIMTFSVVMVHIVKKISHYKVSHIDERPIEVVDEAMEYGELTCIFQKIEDDKVYVLVDDKEFYYDIDSPYKFMGIRSGTEITLKIPQSRSNKIALKIESVTIFRN